MFLQNAQRTDATTDATLTVAGAPNLRRRLDLTRPAAPSRPRRASSATSPTSAPGTATSTRSTPRPARSSGRRTPASPPTRGATRARSGSPRPPRWSTASSTWAAAVPTSTRSNASTGAVLWQTYTGDNSQAGAHYNWSSPLIVGNYAYIGIASNCDNPLVQGQLLEVADLRRAAGTDRQHLQLRAQRPGRRRDLDLARPTTRRPTRSSCPPARSPTTRRPSRRRSSR